jgi:hypothetical protein
MHVDDAKRWLKLLAEKDARVAPLFVGAMGIGKSDIVRQVTKELGIGFVDLRLAQMEPGDLIGIPYRDGNTTKWAVPDWFPKKGTRGIIHLDEINRAPNDVRQTMFQFVWDRRMHLQELESGWLIVSSINPSNGEYQVEELDRAFVRRFCVVSLEPTVDSWMGWAMKDGGISTDITGFIGTHKDMLFEPESFETPVKRNPAGWTVVNNLKKIGAIPRDLEFEIIAGIVGKEAAAAYRKYMDDHYERPVAGEVVLKDYETVRERVLKQKPQQDAMYVTIKELISLIEQKKKLGKKEMENVKDFLLDLSADMQAMFAHNLPPEIVSELGKDDRITEAVGRAMKESKEGKK